ncbi:MAG: ROK family protein, partial [Anaerocolumna sp.]
NALETHFNTPVYLENEANLSVLGEKTFMYDFPNIANISIHSGIGLGMIINHELYTGYNGRAGEFGHTVIAVDGKDCPCGNQGCLEQYVSERALLKEYCKKKSIPEVSFDIFASRYQTGEKEALEIMEEFIKYISVGINNILNAYNPDIVIINSSFTIFFPGLTKLIEQRLNSKMNSFLHILPSSLQDSSILLGGICVVMKNFLGIRSLTLKYKSLM